MLKKRFNLALLCDFYEFTMSNGYFQSGLKDRICYFEIFFRKIPDNGNFVIAAGLEEIIDYIQNLHFDEEDLAYLRAQKFFDENFLNFLRQFRFSGDIYGVKEGELVFPYEPILTVRAKAIEAQLLETFLLLSLNHQSLIATKASRIVYAAQNKPVFEFGSRRAQGVDAALNGARAAFIGGCVSSSCTLAGQIYGLNISGTMAHSWVQMFENELEAFKLYCKLYPDNAILLVDTYDALNGVKNAIKAFECVFGNKNARSNLGIRFDSGNLCQLSKKARLMLDEAGFEHCKIIFSGSLDEYDIQDLIQKKAKVDAFGVGEKLITAKSSPVLGCVYKLVASEEDESLKPKIKMSENNEKMSLASVKKLYRFFDLKSKKAVFDKLYLKDEEIDKIPDLNAVSLQVEIFKEGKLVYKKPSLKEIRAYVQEGLLNFDKDFLEFDNKKTHKLILSQNLQELQNSLVQKLR